MKGNHGSAFIPDGLLPCHKEVGHLAYSMEYTRLRKIFDPLFADHLKRKDAELRRKKYWNDPEWRRKKLDRTNRINRERRAKMKQVTA